MQRLLKENGVEEKEVKGSKFWVKFSKYREFVGECDRVKKTLLETPMFDLSLEGVRCTTIESIIKIRDKLTPLCGECNEIKRITWEDELSLFRSVVADAKKLKKSDEPEERKEEAKMPGSFQKRGATRGRRVAPASKKSEDKQALLPQISVGELMKLVTEGKQLPSLESDPRYVSDCTKAYRELCAAYKKYEDEKAAAARRLEKWKDIGPMYEKIDSATYMALYMRAETEIVKQAEESAKQCESRIAKLLEKNTEKSYADYLKNIETLILAFQGMEAYNGYLDAERKTRALTPTQEQLSLAILHAFNLACAGRVPASYGTLDNRLDGEIKNSEEKILSKTDKKSVSDLVRDLEINDSLFQEKEEQTVFASFIKREYKPLKEIYSDCDYKIKFLKNRYEAWDVLYEQKKKINALEIDLKIKDEERKSVIPEKILDKIAGERKKYQECCGSVEKLKGDKKTRSITECVTSLKTSLSQIQTELNKLFESMQGALEEYYGGDAVYENISIQNIFDDVLSAMQRREAELKEKQREKKEKADAAAAEQKELSEKVSVLEKQTAQQASDLQAKQVEFDRLKKEAADKKTKLDAEIVRLKAEIKTAEGQKKAELKKKEEELQVVREKLQETQKSLASQAKTLDEKIQTLKSKETEISELKEKINSLETGAAGKDKKIEEVSEQLNQLQTELDAERAKSLGQAGELEGVKSALEKANANLEAATQERDTLKASLETERKSTATEKSAKEQAQQEASGLRDELSRINGEFLEKQTELARKEYELKKLQEEAKKKEDELTGQIDSITKEKERESSAQKKKLEEEVKALAKAQSELKEAQETLESKIKELGEKRKALDAQGREIAELTDQLEKLQKSLEDKNTETKKVNDELSSLREKFDELTKAKEKLDQESAERESKLDETKKALKEAEKTIEALKNSKRFAIGEELKQKFKSRKGVSKMPELSAKELLEQIEKATYKGEETEEIRWIKTMVKDIEKIEKKQESWARDYEQYKEEVHEENEVYKELKPLYEQFTSLFNEYNSERNTIMSSSGPKTDKNAVSYIRGGLYAKYEALNEFYNKKCDEIDKLIEQLKKEGKLVSMTGYELFKAIMKDTLTDKQIKNDPEVQKKVDFIRDKVNYLKDGHIDKIHERFEIISKGNKTACKDEYDTFKKCVTEFYDEFADKGQLEDIKIDTNEKTVNFINSIYGDLSDWYGRLKKAEKELNDKIKDTLATEYSKVSNKLANASKEYWEKLEKLIKLKKELDALKTLWSKKLKEQHALEDEFSKLDKKSPKDKKIEKKLEKINEEIGKVKAGIKTLTEKEKGPKDIEASKLTYELFGRNEIKLDDDGIPEEKDTIEAGLYAEWQDLSARRKELAQLLIDTGAASEAEKKVLQSEMSRQGWELAKAKKEVKKLREDLGKIGVPTRWEAFKSKIGEAFKSKIGGEEGRVSRRARKKEVAEKKKEIAAAEERLKTEKLKAKHLRRDFDSLNATPEKVKKNKDSGDYKKLEKAVKEAQKKYDELKKRIFRKPGALRAAEKKLEEAKEAFYEYKKNHPTEPIKYNDGSEEFAQEFAAAVEKAEKEAEEKRRLKVQDRAELPDKKREKEEEEEKFADDRKYIKTYVQIKRSIELFLKEFPNGLPFLEQQKNNKILTAIIRNEAKQRDELGEVIEKGKDAKVAFDQYFAKSAQINALKSYFDIFFDDGGYLHELANSPFNKDDSDFVLMAKELKPMYKKLWTDIYEIPAKYKIIDMVEGKIEKIENMAELCNKLSGKAETIQKAANELIKEMRDNLNAAANTKKALVGKTTFGRGKTANAEAINKAIDRLAKIQEDLEEKYKNVEEKRKELKKVLENDSRSIKGGGYTALASAVANWITVIGLVVPEPISKGVLGAISSTIQFTAKLVEVGDINISWGHGVTVAQSNLKKQINGVVEILNELRDIYEMIITDGTKNALSKQKALTDAVITVLGIANRALLEFSAKCQNQVDKYFQFPCLRTRIVYHALWAAKRKFVKVLDNLMDKKGFNSLSGALRGEVPENRNYKIGF